MKYTHDSVPDPLNWKLIDARTGLDFVPPAGWILVAVDDAEHFVQLQQEMSLALVRIFAPKIIVNVERKLVLLYAMDPREVIYGESESAEKIRVLS